VLRDYPQGMLKLRRFLDTESTSDILDNRLERVHAFAIGRQAMAWLDRSLLPAARFPPGEGFREDHLPIERRRCAKPC